MKKRKRIFVFGMLLVFALIFTQGDFVQAAAKKSPKVIYMTIGKKKKLKANGLKGKVKWSTSKKKVATVSKKGIVTAK